MNGDHVAESVAAHEVRLSGEDGHWRWFCSCGSKGIRLCYRESVERLAMKHGTLIDGLSQFTDGRAPCGSSPEPDDPMYLFRCGDSSCDCAYYRR